MSLLTRMLKQTAVYWPFSLVDEFGTKSVESPVQIKVRWEDKSEEFLGTDGERQISNAVVYVDRNTPVGGILMLGTISDITDAVNIKENSGAWEIRRFDKFPNKKANKFLRTAYL